MQRKVRKYTIHDEDKPVCWQVVTERKLLKLLEQQVLADGTLLHRDRANVTYRVTDYGTRLRTWHGHIVLDANKEA